MQQETYCHMRRNRHYPPPSLPRRIVGWTCILLGLTGLLVPVLPGIVLLMVGTVLLGPHEPKLRRTAFAIRWTLRRWSSASHPLLRHWGWTIRRRHRSVRLLVRSQVGRFQRGEFGRRDYAIWAACALFSAVLFTGVAVALHLSVNHLSQL